MTFPTVPRIQDGTKINAQVTNVPIDRLTQRTQHNNDLINNLLLDNRTIFDINVAVDDACVNDQIVYFDKNTQKYTPAITTITPFGTNQISLPGDESFVVGLVRDVTGSLGSKTGTVITHGFIPGINTANLFEPSVPVEIGAPLHLTRSVGQEGRVTTTRNSREIYIGILVAADLLFLSPDLRNLNDNHKHIVVTLDVTKWIDQGGPGPYLYPESELPFFPPEDPNNLMIYVNPHGAVMNTGSNANNELTVSPDGITYTEALSKGNPIANVADWTDAKAVYTIITPGTEFGVETIESKTAALELTDSLSGDPAISGRLCLDLNLGLQDTTLDANGSKVIKNLALNSNTGQIEVQKGSVVEAITAGSGIQVSQAQGTVQISTTGAGLLEVEITDTLLQNAKQVILAADNITPYVEFPNNFESKINGKFTIPASANINEVSIIARLFGITADPNTARFVIKYKIIPAGDIVTKSFTVTNFTTVFSTAFQHNDFTILSIDPSLLSVGSTVVFQMIRDVADGYPSEIGLMNLRYRM